MFRSLVKLTLLAAIFAASVTAQTKDSKSSFEAKHFSDLIGSISAGNDTAERGAAIKKELADIKVRISTEGFTRKSRDGKMVSGNNIIGEVSNPNAKRSIMLGAHYDRVAEGKGAVDNASGSAAILLLLRAFKDRPLKNINLQTAFWDHEELGLHGSRIFVENRREKGLPAMYINFDVYGYGDTLWLWAGADDGDFLINLLKESSGAKFPISHGKVYPPSDHISFQNGGVESYSFSLLSADEIKVITKLLGGEPPAAGQMPIALATIHTANDTTDKIDAVAVVRSMPIIEAAIRALDK